MDFWDLTVLILRRWKFALPMLLLTIGMTGYVAKTAKPDYTMTSYVQFIPAKVAPTDNPVEASLRNPWNQLGLFTLGQASVYKTQDQGFVASLEASKHTTNFTLTITYPNPIITVEVIAKTPKDARDTTDLVDGRLRDSAEAMQRQAGVRDTDLIATQRVDAGQNVLPSGSKVKRAIFAVAAAGLILTAGGTVAVDAILRRRARKRRAKDEADSPPPEPGPVNGKAVSAVPTAAPLEVAAARGHANSQPELPPGETSADRPVSLAGKAPSPSMERTAVVVKRAGSVAKQQPAAKSTRPPQAATYRSVNAQNEPNGEGHDAAPAAPNGKSGPTESDVRVVLQPKWVAGENGGKSH